MNSFPYKIRFAYKNIIKNKGNSFVIFLSLSILMTLFILSFSMFSALKQVLYYEGQQVYQQFDLVMTYDENSSARIINKRTIEEEYQDYFKSICVFFNFYTLVETDQSLFYTEVLSSTEYELERLIDKDVPTLGEREVIITKSSQENNLLEIGDTLQLSINGMLFDYQVSQIIDDFGVFSGEKIFLRKDTILEDIYGMTIFNNFGNTVYFDVKDDQSIDEIISLFEQNEDFADYYLFKTIDETEIIREATYNATLFAGVGLLMIIAFVMVLHSLLPLLFKDYSKQLGVIDSLGGDKFFLIEIWSIQLIIYLIVSSIVGIISVLFLLNQGALIYGITHSIYLDGLMTILAILIITILVFLDMLFFIKKMNKKTIVELSTDYRYEKQTFYYFFTLFIFSFLAILIFIHPFKEEFNAFFTTIISILCFINLFSITLNLISKQNRLKKKTLFSLFSLKHLHDNKYIHNSMKVLFVAFQVILTTLAVRSYIVNEIEVVKNQLQVDYAVLNIFNYNESMKTEIETAYVVESVDEAIIFQETVLTFDTGNTNNRKNVHFFVSMEYNKFENYFVFHLKNEIEEQYLNNTLPYIVLPENLHYIYGANLGDVIYVDISSELSNIAFVVGGFFETNYDNVVYSNLFESELYQGIVSSNTILINSNQEGIYEELIRDYSAKMYYILDMDILISSISGIVLNVNNLFEFLSTIIVLCFIVVIINNITLMFYTMKSDFAKLKSLGLDSVRIAKNLFLEGLILFVIVIAFASIEAIILIPNLPKVMIIFGYYKSIIPSFSLFLISIGIVFIVYCLSYFIYFLRIKRLQIIEEIKKY